MRTLYCVLIVTVALLEGCQALAPRAEFPSDVPPPAEVAKEKLAKTLPLKDRAEVAAALSKTHLVTLDTIAGYYPYARSDRARPITVENELACVGARVSVDGKLVDHGGKEIQFEIRYGSGAQLPVPPQEIVEANRRKNEERRKKYTVIDVDLDPFNIAP